MPDTESNRPLRVFLCHATSDKPAVRELYHRLTADGFAPWLDEEDLLPGHDWQYEIPKAVRQSDVVIVCLSPQASNKTGYIQKEIKFALDAADEKPEGTIFLIPLKLAECDVPDRLSRWQWVNLFSPNGYERLLRALRQRAADLNVPATAAVSTPPAPESRGSSVSSVSGGVNVDANNVTVGIDVVGRDKIIQAATYIEHAAIIQPSSLQPETAPTLNTMTWGGLQFVRVPAGKFLMGSKDDNKFADSAARPQHTIEIPYDYWIARYPVTNEQFARFVTASKYKFDQGQWQTKADHPVVKVSWLDAMAYCRWLNDTLHGELKDLTLRLPTEAEWEKAARSTQGHTWPWGNDWDPKKCNSEGIRGGTTPVGTYSPQGDSPYGAADMVGNVWEWCHSLYKPYPYQANDGRENEAGDDSRVVRGGSWNFSQDAVRCVCRYFGYRPGYREDSIGFRCMVSADSSF